MIDKQRKVAILTDSASDIPFDMQEKHGIDIMSFYITVDDKTYIERVDMDFEQYYDILTKCEGIPKTSQITSLRFAEQFCKYDDEGYTDVLYVSINSGGSNTNAAAHMAAEQFATEDRPNSKMKIHIVDSKSYSMVYGYHVCEAAKKIKNGAEISEVIEYLEDKFSRMEVVISVYTLKYIKKSGRISAAAAFAGELLGLRPIITIIDGVSKTASKVRGDANVMSGLCAHCKDNIADKGEYMIGITDAQNGKMLSAMCKKQLGYAPKCTFLIGSAVATNTGPNAVAIVYEGKRRV